MHSKTTGHIVFAMARPRQHDHRREDLLQKGIDLLVKHGYHGTGLKKILDTVEVPKGSFYNYFESKEQFVAEIIDHYSQTMLGKLDAFIEHAGDDPVAAIRGIYTALLDEIEKNGQTGCLIGNLAAEIGASSSLCQASMHRSYAAWEQRLVQFISAAQDQGLVRQDLAAGVLCNILWNTWQGALLRMKIDGSTTHLKQTVDVLLDHLFLPAVPAGNQHP